MAGHDRNEKTRALNREYLPLCDHGNSCPYALPKIFNCQNIILPCELRKNGYCGVLKTPTSGATAIYPGTFDPITSGHLDIVGEAARIFGRVVVGVGINPRKVALFSVEERLEMLRSAFDERGWPHVEAASFSGLTVDFAREQEAPYIVRGLRAVTDFENEMSLVLANEQLDPAIKTLFLMPSHGHLYLSSSIVRQAAEIGRRVIPGSVPRGVETKLKEKFGF